MAGGRASGQQGGATLIDDDDIELDDEGLRALAILIVIILLCTRCCCRCWCCRRFCFFRCCPPRAAVPADEGVQPVQANINDGTYQPAVKLNGDVINVSSDYLRRKKSMATAYLLWFPFGLMGIHHFYLDRIAHGLLAAWSLNFVGIGYIIDAFFIPLYLRSANKQTVSTAPGDKSIGRIICRGSLGSIVVISFFACVLIKGPRTVHNAGVVDLDQKIAGTSVNPYDVLQVARSTSNDDALAECRKAFDALRAMPTCNSKCSAKKSDLRKVNNFFNGTTWRKKPEKEEKSSSRKTRSRKAREPVKVEKPRDPWDDWTDFMGAEWSALVDISKDAINKASGSKSEEHQEM